jgi:hypothetical protein
MLIGENLALLAVAALGGAAMNAAGLPAGWLTGAMFSTALASLWRRWEVAPSGSVIGAGMLMTGCMIGAAATPDAVAFAARYPGSLILLLASTLVTLVTGSLLLRRWGGWRPLDSLLASAPGALSALMSVAREKGADIPNIAVIQFFRLFILMAAIPSLLVLFGVGSGRPMVPAVAGVGDTALMLVAGGVSGLVLFRLGIVAPLVLGATLSSAVLHAAGVVEGNLPPLFAIAAFVILGGMIGARMGTLQPAALRQMLPMAVVAFLLTVSVALLFAWPASLIAGVSYGAAFIAFAPGGLEAMAMLAVALGLDPLYIGVHHLTRFVAVGLMLPLIVAYALREEARLARRQPAPPVEPR